MNTRSEAETKCQSTKSGSQDGDEENGVEEQPITCWSELSITERVGLNSVEMSESDLEAAFSQIVLALHCDRYTLNQRLQAEAHARNLAEENIQLELTRSRETLEILKSMCLDSKRSTILQSLELCLDILSGTAERISNTAEVLGAVHQEARVSRTVELMVAHVENLKRRHDRNVADLEEAKRLIQQQESTRNLPDSTLSPDLDEGDTPKKSSKQNTLRRRVSASVISSQTQEKRKQDLKNRVTLGAFSKKKTFPACPSPSLSSESSCSAMTKDDCYSVDDRTHTDPGTMSEAAHILPAPSTTPNPECCVLKQKAPRKTQRKRHMGKCVSTEEQADKDRKGPMLSRQLSGGECESWWRQHSLAHCLYGCRLTLRCLYCIFVLLCVVTLFYFLCPNM